MKAVLLMILACLAALLVAGCAAIGTSETAQEEAAAESPAERPNMIFILTDDLDYASARKMPEINSLLRDEGASFENTFVSHSICCPSRATILTGLYDHNHNVISNRPPDGGFQKFLSEGHEEDSIAVRLQEGGYQTGFFGKYLNGYTNADPTHVPPGWDEWYGKINEQKLYDYSLNENGEEVAYGSEPEAYLTDVLSGHAIDFVKYATAEDQPFFAYVAPRSPHSPATPAERHKGAFAGEEAPRPLSFNEEDVSDKPDWVQDLESVSEQEASRIDERYQERQEATLAVDEMVGSLVEELEAVGELENTYIIFTSDNGFHLGTHRLRHGKKTPYEEAARVPLFVRGPGVLAGSTVDDLVLNNDLAPTFADLADLEGFEADGRSLAPLMGGEEPPDWRSAVLLEAFLDGRSASEEGDAETDDEGDPGKDGGEGNRTEQTAFGAVRTKTHQYVEHEKGEKELYDLEADPYELENVYETADPALVEDLKARLEVLKNCSGDGCREAEDPP